jgi:hypothetical protein
MNGFATIALALIVALGATGADAATHKHHRGRHWSRHAAQNSFARDAKRGDITIDRKGNIVPAPRH